MTYDNERLLFSDQSLNDKLSLSPPKTSLLDQVVTMTQEESNFALNWLLYSQVVFPTKVNEFTSGSSTRVGYDNLFWRDTQSQRISLHDTSISTNSFGSLLSQSSWPLDAPLNFATRTSSDIVYIGSANANLLRNSNSAKAIVTGKQKSL